MNTTFLLRDENDVARLSAPERVERIASFPLDKHGETRHDLHRLNLRGLYSFCGYVNEKRGDHNSRQFRCEELRARRAALRLMAELGMGPDHVGGGADCSGRSFCSYAELVHVDTSYEYALVKSSHSIDC